MNYIISKNKYFLKNIWVVIQNINSKNKSILKSFKTKNKTKRSKQKHTNKKIPQKSKQNINFTYVTGILLVKERNCSQFLRLELKNVVGTLDSPR